MSNMIFRPVKGTDRNIQALEKVEGSLYFATDSGKIYLDTDGQRIPMGGGGGSAEGASVFYGSAEELVEENELYNIEKTKVEGYPRINDLILNSAGFLIGYGVYLIVVSLRNHQKQFTKSPWIIIQGAVYMETNKQNVDIL